MISVGLPKGFKRVKKYLVGVSLSVSPADRIKLLGAHPAASGEHELEVVQAGGDRNLVDVFAGIDHYFKLAVHLDSVVLFFTSKSRPCIEEPISLAS